MEILLRYDEYELDILKPMILNKIDAAKQYYDTGMNHARNNDYVKALSYLRGACRLDNTSSLYWNDLGVTEMRMGQYHMAKHRFIKALAIDDQFSTAIENLKDIKGYLSAEEYEYGIIKYRPQHQRLDARVIDMDTLLSASYKNDSILHTPFIIKNAARSLGWDMNMLAVKRLVKKYSQHRVDFYPHNMLYDHVYPYFTSLADGIRQLLHYPEGIYDDIDVSRPGTYVQWNLESYTWSSLMKDVSADGKLPSIFTDEHWISSCLDDDMINEFYLKTHWKMVLIGEEMSGMFNHQDTLRTASWQIQIQGRKRWHLCSSAESRRLYNAGDVDTFNPDYKRYPKFRKVKECYEAVMEPGDMIYYPHDYWHQTMNLDTPTIAVTGTIVTSRNYRLMEEELVKECAGRATIFRADAYDRLCQQLHMCFQTWRDLYHVDDRMGESEEGEL